MELLNFILFCTSFSFLSFSTFCNLMMMNLFLRVVYKLNIMSLDGFDPIILFMNIINILLHLFVFYTTNLMESLGKNNWCNWLFTNYNYFNNKYVGIKNTIIHSITLGPLKFLMGKLVKSNNQPNQSNQSNPTMEPFNITNIIQQIKLENRNGINNGFQTIPNIKKQQIDSNIQLNTNKEISNFLDNLLVNNKTD